MANRPDLLDRFLAAYFRHGWRGFLTLCRWLHRPSIVLRTRYGAILRLQPSDYIDGIVLREGYYESEVFDGLRPYFAPGLVLWDIGANLGLHCLSAACTEPTLQIHAFEPNPAMHVRLTEHVRLNRAAISAWPQALGERDGRATLHVNAAGNPGMTTLTPWSEARYDAQVDVPLARADTLVAQGLIPAPNLIKLDVEGAEPAVLAGLGGLLHQPTLRAVVFETRADLLADPARCAIARQLLAAGFTLQALTRHERTHHELGNFLARRAAP